MTNPTREQIDELIALDDALQRNDFDLSEAPRHGQLRALLAAPLARLVKAAGEWLAEMPRRDQDSGREWMRWASRMPPEIAALVEIGGEK